MANLDEVQKLKVDQLRELAVEHGVEVAESDKKDDLVLKLADGVTDEQLEAYVAKQADDEGSEGAGSEGAGSEDEGSEGADVTPVVSDEDAAAAAAEAEENAAKEQAARDAAKAVDTKLGSSKEESAAARAGVSEENLENPRQNREPKNEGEKENQKVTEQERKAAQKASDVKAKTHNENALTPGEQGEADASEGLTAAINNLAKAGNKDNFVLQAEEGVEPRFSLVRNKATGEVLLRDNGDGTLSQIQLKSLEEKENDLQGTEVEEL